MVPHSNVGTFTKKNDIKMNSVTDEIREIQKKNNKLIRNAVGKFSLKYEVVFFLKIFSKFVSENVDVVTKRVISTLRISIKKTNVNRLFEEYNNHTQSKN